MTQLFDIHNMHGIKRSHLTAYSDYLKKASPSSPSFASASPSLTFPTFLRTNLASCEERQIPGAALKGIFLGGLGVHLVVVHLGEIFGTALAGAFGKAKFLCLLSLCWILETFGFGGFESHGFAKETIDQLTGDSGVSRRSFEMESPDPVRLGKYLYLRLPEICQKKDPFDGAIANQQAQDPVSPDPPPEALSFPSRSSPWCQETSPTPKVFRCLFVV